MTVFIKLSIGKNNEGAFLARLPRECRVFTIGRLRRRGFTLPELLMSVAIMSIVSIGIGSLAVAVHSSSDYSTTHATVTQHARIALNRMEQAIDQAYANEQFPGFLVLSEADGTYDFPDTLVVWRPAKGPADSEGLPSFDELVIFSPDPDSPGTLLEITTPLSGTASPISNRSQWVADVKAIIAASSSVRIPLTHLLRVGAAPSGNRGVVRFEGRQLPSASQWKDYLDGSLAWEDLSWAQGLQGPQTGIRQGWVAIEIQLVPPLRDSGAADPSRSSAALAVPFFGSGAIYYEMNQ